MHLHPTSGRSKKISIFFIIGLLLISNPSFIYCQAYLLLNFDCNRDSLRFGKIHVIDNRDDGQPLGYVQTGVLNRPQQVLFQGSIAHSLSRLGRHGAVWSILWNGRIADDDVHTDRQNENV